MFKRFTPSMCCVAVVTASISFVGCKDAASNAKSATGETHDGDVGHHHGAENHASEGPHHGSLIELGNEEYHAELVHDETTGSVTVYVLDAAITQQVPIDASEITINVKHDGTPKQFKMAASPDANDTQGKSSRFYTNDKELGEHLDEEGSDPKLVLTIDGKSFRGTIAH